MSLAKRLAESGIRGPLFDRYASQIESGIYKRDQHKYIDDRKELEKHVETLQGRDKPGNSEKRKGLDILIEEMDKEARMATNTDLAPVLIPSTVPFIPSEEKPCSILYDPCTREPLSGMPELERRVREIKKQADTTPAGLYGLTNATTNYDFLMGPFLDKSISLDDLVSFRLHSNGQVGSDIYEVMCRLFVFFGGIKDVNPQQGGNYKFVEKFEASVRRMFPGPREAFQSMKCKADSTSGMSDITLVRVSDAGEISTDKPYCETDCSVRTEETIRTYIMSVKWYKQEKNAEHYDLEKLKTGADKVLSAEQLPYGIIVFLKSKLDFERAHQRASRQYVRHIGKTYFGWDEDVQPFLEDIRRQIFEEAELRAMPPASIMEQRYFVAGAKHTLGLQLHQEIITKSICDTFEKSTDNQYLIGVLPRGGKTYIAGGIIREYIRRKEARQMNVLWLTAAPTETRSQVGRDLIEKFQDFADFEFVDIVHTAEIKKKKPFTFFFCSTQLLTQKDRSRKREDLIKLIQEKDNLGLLFYDEAHKTATGNQTKDEITKIRDKYSRPGLPFIFLTATYYNILFDYRILPENTFIWDYTDVLKTRGLATSSEQDSAIQNLKSRFYLHEQTVTEIIARRQANGESLHAMGKPYMDFPELYFISADIQDEAKARFEAHSAYRPDSGFSMKSIFGIRYEAKIGDIRNAAGSIRPDAYRAFDNLVNPRNMISLLTPGTESFGDGQEGGEPLTKEARAMLEPSILGRIHALSRTADSRFRLDESPTLLMFMPTGGAGSRIYYTLCAWAALLMSHPWWKARYEVACVVDQGSLSTEELVEIATIDSAGTSNIHVIRDDPKAHILKLERDLHCPIEGESKGLVVLAGQKLSMGVSLPCTDVVFLFNDSKSPDDIIQKMYRGLTPSPGKKAAFVVDLNPVRSLAAVYGYTRAANGEKALTSSTLLDIIYDTYSWDADVYDLSLSKGADSRPQTFQQRLHELFEQAEQDKEYRVQEDFGGIERKVGENVERFMTSQMVSDITNFMSEKRMGSAHQIALRDGTSATIRGGKLVIREPVAGAGTDEPVMKETIVIENFKEAIIDLVKYLAITSQQTSLETAVQEYASDTSLQKNVNDLMVSRGAIQRADPRIIEIFIRTIQGIHSRGMGRMYGDTKAKIDEPSARKNAVLTLINKRLTPRKKQKDESGEVFTPIELVEEMLSHLPSSVWKNPDLVWLDPANGIGNFPIIAFYRLNDGLKDVIPDEKKRRKHIIENMLYMMEFSSSNSRIARNIFTKLCDGCKPNIWTMDSLTVTPELLDKEGWPKKFDVIMGNPPYNTNGILKGGGTTWPKFMKLAFNLIAESGFICFIHPPGWRKFYDEEDRDNQGKLWYIIRENGWNLDYVNVSDQPPKHFPIVDYYVIHAKKTNKPTKYDSKFMGITDSGETILDYPFIPNMLNDETMGILKKLFKAKGEPIHIIRNQSFQPSKADEGKSGTPHYHFTDKGGKKHIYNKQYATIPEYINKDKVLLTFSNGYEKGKLFAFYSNENYGTTGSTMYMLIPSKPQGDKLVKFFNSDIVTFLMKITQYSPSPNHKNEFKILNQLEVPDSLDYGLTAKEEELIKKIVGAKDDEPAKGGGKQRRFTRKVRRV